MNVAELEVEMIRKGVTKKDLAEILGISTQCLYNKLNNEAEFKASEIIKTAKRLKLTASKINIIFFNNEVELNSTEIT